MGDDLRDERLGDGPVRVLYGERGGRYPHGNSVLIEGRRESALVDASLAIAAHRDRLPPVARLLHSHCHEDHVAGSHLFPDVPWHFHELDAPGIRSLEAMLEIYGLPGEIEAAFRELLLQQFHFRPRPDPTPFRDADAFDLGGARVEVVHTPGHTRGHSCFHVRWPGDDGGALYLGDIDLSSFGPYYGDAWSQLADFERSLERVRGIEARWYVTFHHIGVLDRAGFLARLDRYAGVIADREERLLAYLETPHTLEDIVRHRFVYRPGDEVIIAEPVERRSMSQHLERLLADGRVEALGGGRFRRRGD